MLGENRTRKLVGSVGEGRSKIFPICVLRGAREMLVFNVGSMNAKRYNVCAMWQHFLCMIILGMLVICCIHHTNTLGHFFFSFFSIYSQ